MKKLIVLFSLIFIVNFAKAQCSTTYKNLSYAPCPYDLVIYNSDTLHQSGTNYFCFKGDTIYNIGTFHDTLVNYLGCDSITIINVDMAAIISYEHYDIPYCTNDSTTRLWLDNSLTCYSKWLTEIKHSIQPKPFLYILNGYLYFGDSCKNRNFLTDGDTYFYSCDSNKIVSSSWGEFLMDSILIKDIYSIIFPPISGNYSLVIYNRGDIDGPSYIGGGGTIYCDDTSNCIFLSLSTGINFQQGAFENSFLKVSPNPCIDELKISTTENLKISNIEVIDLLGRNCLSIENLQSKIVNEIDVSHLISQVYFLKATDDKGFVHQSKFVKQ